MTVCRPPPPNAPRLHPGKLSDDLISLVNKARKDAGLSTVQFSQELEDAAQKEADELAGGTTTPLPGRLTWTTHAGALLKHAGKGHAA